MVGRRSTLSSVLALLCATPAPAGAGPPGPNAVPPPTVRIATGEIGGTYTALGESLRRTLAAAGPALRMQLTNGSLENLLAVSRHEADFGLVQLDLLTFLSTVEAYEPVLRKLRLVAPLYLEEVHIVVRAGAGITRPEELKGKRVNIGPDNSGSSFSARILLRHHGVAEATVALDRRSSSDAVVALLAGQLDAVFLTAGQPVRYLRELDAKAGAQISLLSLGRDKGLRYQRSKLPYRAASIAPGIYPWLADTVHTIATPCVLVANVGADGAVVGAVAKAIYEQRDLLARLHPKWSQVDFETASAVVGAGHLPLHPAAAQHAKGPATPGPR